MIDVADLRIFVCTTPTNMTYSFDSLMGRTQEIGAVKHQLQRSFLARTSWGVR